MAATCSRPEGANGRPSAILQQTQAGSSRFLPASTSSLLAGTGRQLPPQASSGGHRQQQPARQQQPPAGQQQLAQARSRERGSLGANSRGQDMRDLYARASLRQTV
jgi:hypothetical protein